MEGCLGRTESPALVHMFTFCGMAFLGEGQALSCSWFELDTVLLG